MEHCVVLQETGAVVQYMQASAGTMTAQSSEHNTPAKSPLASTHLKQARKPLSRVNLGGGP